MSWMQLTLSPNDITIEKHVQIQNSFEQAFMRASAPKDAAMFTNSSNHGQYLYFFSPRAASIFSAQLKQLGVIECEAPSRADTTLLVGHADAIDMLTS